jgi:hypothetical protein
MEAGLVPTRDWLPPVPLRRMVGGALGNGAGGWVTALGQICFCLISTPCPHAPALFPGLKAH